MINSTSRELSVFLFPSINHTCNSPTPLTKESLVNINWIKSDTIPITNSNNPLFNQ